jgi:hypothetical protein
MSEDTGEVVLKKRPHSCICGVPCSEEFKSLAEKHLRLAATLAAALEKIEGQWVNPKAELEGWCKQPDCDFGPAPAGLPEHRQYCAFQIAHEALSLAREMGVLK